VSEAWHRTEVLLQSMLKTRVALGAAWLAQSPGSMRNSFVRIG
jgi:hypothetical protein